MDSEDNKVEIEDENDYKLSVIINNKKIKIVLSENRDEFIKIFLNNKQFCSKNISESPNLNDMRNILNHDIKQDFVFLDIDSCDIEKDDEKDYSVKDILKNQTIYLKFNKIKDQEPGSNPTPKTEPEHESTPLKKRIDFFKYKEVKNKEFDSENIKLYRYSEVKEESKHERVYEYFYDEFNDVNDFKEAYIVLFYWKTGDGKSTAINAFFNIVKGVRLEDEYLFILINEKEKDGCQAVSQTLHDKPYFQFYKLFY